MIDVFRDVASDFWRSASRTFRRHPVEILLGIAMATVASVLVAGGPENGWSLDLGLLASIPLTIASVFAVTALERLDAIEERARIGLTLAVLAAGLFYAWWLGNSDGIAEMWRWLTLVLSVGSAVTLVPLAAKGSGVSRAVRFWRFNARLAARVLVSCVYLGLLYIGLRIGLTAVGEMFERLIMHEVYEHWAGWLFFGAGPWMILAASEDILDVEKAIPQTAVQWIARLGSFLFLPLIVLYLVITYGYGVRVVFTDFAPSNVISPLVLGAGIFGFLGLYLVEPLRHRDDYNLLSKLFHIFPVAFLAVLPLSLWAVFERVFQYGWTEFRYLRVLAILLFGVLCIYAGLRLIRRRTMPLYAVPMVVAIGSFFAATGPGNVVEISKSSQLDRLVSAAEQGGMVGDDGTIDPGQLAAAPQEQRNSASEAANYLRNHHGDEVMEHLVPQRLALDDWTRAVAIYARSRSYGRGRHADRAGVVRLEYDGPWRVDGAGTLYDVEFAPRHGYGTEFEEDGQRLRVRFEDEVLTVRTEFTEGVDEWRASFEEAFDVADERAVAREVFGELPRELAVVPLRDAAGEQVGSVLVARIVVKTDPDDLSGPTLEGRLLIDEVGDVEQ